MIVNENNGSVDKIFETLLNIQHVVNEFKKDIIADRKINALDLVKTYEFKVGNLKKSAIFDEWQIDYINWDSGNKFIFIDALNTICNKLYGRIYNKEDFVEIDEAMQYVWSKVSQITVEEYSLFKAVLKLNTDKLDSILNNQHIISISNETDNRKGINALVIVVNIIQNNANDEFDYTAIRGYYDFKNSFDTVSTTSKDLVFNSFVDKLIGSLIKAFYVIKQGNIYEDKVKKAEGEQVMCNSTDKKISDELMTIARRYSGMCDACCEQDIYNDLFNFIRNNYSDKDYDDFVEDEDDDVYDEHDDYIEVMTKIGELDLTVLTLKNTIERLEKRISDYEKQNNECKKVKLKKKNK